MAVEYPVYAVRTPAEARRAYADLCGLKKRLASDSANTVNSMAVDGFLRLRKLQLALGGQNSYGKKASFTGSIDS